MKPRDPCWDSAALQRVQEVARGELEGDLAIQNARVINVFTGEILERTITVIDGFIASVSSTRPARTQLDLGGRYLCPGLIDAHVHVESSMVAPAHFARAVAALGTTTVICDPHEIANVAGLPGIRWFLDASTTPFVDILVMASSCVPATPLATSGANLDARDLASLKSDPRIIGLAEVMNVPGVVFGDRGVQAKLLAFGDLPVDGHAPGLGGGWLDAYCAAGIHSDHECISADEARAKLRRGMSIFLRESTGAKNLVDLLAAVNGQTAHLCCLCSDDRHPHDLVDEGHLDHLIRLAIGAGLDPVQAIQMATINTAERFQLTDRGAISPGRRADFVVCSDLSHFAAEMVFTGGQQVAQAGHCTLDAPLPEVDPEPVMRPFTVDLDALDFRIHNVPNPVRVIGVIKDQIVTTEILRDLPQINGALCADPGSDIAKIAVVERHRGTGNVGLGFVQGLGIRRGAVASTIAHDHHNLVIAGADDQSMHTAAAAAVDCRGGLIVAEGDTVLASLSLPLGGLMADRPVSEIRDELEQMLAAARELGCRSHDPFMSLSFLALEVIPALKITDQGLIDVGSFEIVPLSAGGP